MNVSITFRGCHVLMPNLEVSSFVTLGICWNQKWFIYEQFPWNHVRVSQVFDNLIATRGELKLSRSQLNAKF